MRLVEALRLSSMESLALVGAGGKTTALFKLARELLQPEGPAQTVFVSTTTHLAIEQANLADYAIVIDQLDDIERIASKIPKGIVLATGIGKESGRLAGLDLTVLEILRDLAQNNRFPLIIEADGSRQLPLKAPASHEPVVPEWIEQVVVVAGLSGLNQPLGPTWVHRSDRFARLSGIEPGDPITLDALQGVLVHPDGGLKGIPITARRIVLLNQADNPMLLSQGGQLARSLLGEYSSALVTALSPPESSIDPIPPGVQAVFEPVAGVVLAAGGASRLGLPKQLLEWKSEPLVRHAVHTALQAGLSPVIVVTGAYGDMVNNVLGDLPVRLVHNQNWQAGQSTSMQAGLSALQQNTGAVVFMLADQPQVPVDLVRGLIAYHCQTLAPVVAPIVDGQRANPVLFDRTTFHDLYRVEGDVGGRAIFSKFPVAWLPWHDLSLLLDIDQPEDYQALQELPAQ